MAIAVLPAGTLTAKSYVALSRGVSLTGNQPGAPWGSLTTNAPSSVGIQPSLDPSGSTISCGCPEYSTMTTNPLPRRSLDRGVMVSSWPDWLNEARLRFTLRREIA